MASRHSKETQLCAYCIAMSKARNRALHTQPSKPAAVSIGQSSQLLFNISVAAGGSNKASDTSAIKTDTAKVESLSRAMVEAINKRDFDNTLFTRLTDPNLAGGTIDRFDETTTLAAHLDKFRTIIAESPEYHMHIEGVSSDFDGDQARVYVASRVTGRPAGLARGSMGVFTWERRRDVVEGWWLVANANWRTSGLERQSTSSQTGVVESLTQTDIAKLKSWAYAMIDAINARDFKSPVFQLASPDMKSSGIDVFPITGTREAWIDKFQKMTTQNPEYHMQLDDVTIDPEDGGKHVKGYLSVRVSGMPPGLARGAIGVLTWRRGKNGEGWCLIGHETMRSGEASASSTAPSASTGDKGCRSDDIAKLKSWTQAVIEAINARDFDGPLFQSLDPHHQSGSKHLIQPADTVEEWIQKFRTITEEHPEYNVVVDDIVIDLEPGSAAATGYMYARVTGMPPGLAKGLMVVINWKKEGEDDWRVSAHKTVRTGDLSIQSPGLSDVKQLEFWTRATLEAINARDFDNPLFERLSQLVEYDGKDIVPPANTPAEWIQTFRTMIEEHPEHHMHVDDITVDLECGGQYAKGLVSIRVSGMPPGITRPAMVIFTWKKDDGDWRMIKHETMRTGDLSARCTRAFEINGHTQDSTSHPTRGSQLLSKIEAMAEAADKTDHAAHQAEIARLEEFSRTFVHATNAREFDHPVFKLASPDLKGGFEESFGPTNTFEGHLEKFLQIVAESPEYYIEIVDLHTDLELSSETARVYMANRVTGRPPGLIKDAIGVFTWRRHDNDEGWLLIANENCRTAGMGSHSFSAPGVE